MNGNRIFMIKAEKGRALSLLTELQEAKSPQDYEEMVRLSELYLRTLDEIFVEGLLVVEEIKGLVRLINRTHARSCAAFTNLYRIIRWQAVNLQDIVERSVALTLPADRERRTFRVFSPCCCTETAEEARAGKHFYAECRHTIEEEREAPNYRMPEEEEGLYRECARRCAQG